jgi:hypothetical protein
VAVQKIFTPILKAQKAKYVQRKKRFSKEEKLGEEHKV